MEVNKELKDVILSLRQDMVEIRTSVAKLNTRMDSFERSFTSLIQTQKNQQNEIEALKKSLHEMSTVKMEAIQEMEAREQRRLSLVISGICERTDGNVDERNKSDRESVTTLLDAIGVINPSFHDVRRIGKVQYNRSRLIRITCSNTEEKNVILRNAKKLRSVTCFKKVFINSDLTPMQQKMHKELRDELKRRKNEGENVRIRHGEIVRIDQNFQ